jgi:hypothetical protein
LELDGTHQLLISADDVIMLSENISNVSKNKETLLEASREIGQEVGPD